MNFQGCDWRFQCKNITNSTVSRHISSNSKCRACKRSSINKKLVFKRDVNKSSRIKGDVEERGNKENSTCSRGVFEQLIPFEEK